MNLKEEIERIEMEKIAEALEAAKYNVSEAARLLGVSRTTLHSKIKKYGFQKAIVLSLAD